MVDASDVHDLLDISPSNFYIQLDRAQDIAEVKRLRDIASAVENYAQSIKLNTDEINKAAEARIWAEYKAGKLLSDIPRAQGMRSDLTLPMALKKFEGILVELKINRGVAYQWMKLSQIPEENLRNFI